MDNFPSTSPLETTSSRPSRRHFGALCAALLAGTAGCSDIFGSDDTGGNGEYTPVTVETIPADAEGLMQAESPFLANEATAPVIDDLVAAVAPFDEQSAPTYGDLLGSYVDDPAIDHEHSTGFYRTVDGESRFAIAILTNNDSDAVVDRTETELGRLTATSYQGVSVHESSAEQIEWLAVPDESLALLGPKQAVQDSIDTGQGNRDRLDGRLLSVYHEAAAGQFRAVTEIQGGELEHAAESFGGEIAAAINFLPEVLAFAASYREATGAEAAQLDLLLMFESTQDAEDAAEMIDTIAGDHNIDSDEPIAEQAMVDRLAATHQGEHVLLEIITTESELLDYMESYGDALAAERQ